MKDISCVWCSWTCHYSDIPWDQQYRSSEYLDFRRLLRLKLLVHMGCQYSRLSVLWAVWLVGCRWKKDKKYEMTRNMKNISCVWCSWTSHYSEIPRDHQYRSGGYLDFRRPLRPKLLVHMGCQSRRLSVLWAVGLVGRRSYGL